MVPASDRFAESTFVVAHALPGTAAQMEPLAAELRSKGKVEVVEFPDCGASRDEASTDPDRLVNFLRDRVERLAPANVTLVGFSFGAWAAARLAAVEAPIVLKRLVLLGGFCRLTAEHGKSYAALAEDLEVGRVTPAELVPLVLGLYFPSGAPGASMAGSVGKLISDLSPPRAARTLRRAAALAQPKYEVMGYGVPALVLHARGDAAVPLFLGEELAKRGTESVLRVIETDSHYLPGTHTAECLRAMT
jgi:pimeloyl-ACP methyl ester carboxylesterase